MNLGVESQSTSLEKTRSTASQSEVSDNSRSVSRSRNATTPARIRYQRAISKNQSSSSNSLNEYLSPRTPTLVSTYSKSTEPVVEGSSTLIRSETVSKPTPRTTLTAETTENKSENIFSPVILSVEPRNGPSRVESTRTPSSDNDGQQFIINASKRQETKTLETEPTAVVQYDMKDLQKNGESNQRTSERSKSRQRAPSRPKTPGQLPRYSLIHEIFSQKDDISKEKRSVSRMSIKSQSNDVPTPKKPVVSIHDIFHPKKNSDRLSPEGPTNPEHVKVAETSNRPKSNLRGKTPTRTVGDRSSKDFHRHKEMFSTPQVKPSQQRSVDNKPMSTSKVAELALKFSQKSPENSSDKPSLNIKNIFRSKKAPFTDSSTSSTAHTDSSDENNGYIVPKSAIELLSIPGDERANDVENSMVSEYSTNAKAIPNNREFQRPTVSLKASAESSKDQAQYEKIATNVNELVEENMLVPDKSKPDVGVTASVDSQTHDGPSTLLADKNTDVDLVNVSIASMTSPEVVVEVFDVTETVAKANIAYAQQSTVQDIGEYIAKDVDTSACDELPRAINVDESFVSYDGTILDSETGLTDDITADLASRSSAHSSNDSVSELVPQTISVEISASESIALHEIKPTALFVDDQSSAARPSFSLDVVPESEETTTNRLITNDDSSFQDSNRQANNAPAQERVATPSKIAKYNGRTPSPSPSVTSTDNRYSGSKLRMPRVNSSKSMTFNREDGPSNKRAGVIATSDTDKLRAKSSDLGINQSAHISQARSLKPSENEKPNHKLLSHVSKEKIPSKAIQSSKESLMKGDPTSTDMVKTSTSESSSVNTSALDGRIDDDDTTRPSQLVRSLSEHDAAKNRPHLSLIHPSLTRDDSAVRTKEQMHVSTKPARATQSISTQKLPKPAETTANKPSAQSKVIPARVVAKQTHSVPDPSHYISSRYDPRKEEKSEPKQTRHGTSSQSAESGSKADKASSGHSKQQISAAVGNAPIAKNDTRSLSEVAVKKIEPSIELSGSEQNSNKPTMKRDSSLSKLFQGVESTSVSKPETSESKSVSSTVDVALPNHHQEKHSAHGASGKKSDPSIQNLAKESAIHRTSSNKKIEETAAKPLHQSSRAVDSNGSVHSDSDPKHLLTKSHAFSATHSQMSTKLNEAMPPVTGVQRHSSLKSINRSTNLSNLDDQHGHTDGKHVPKTVAPERGINRALSHNVTASRPGLQKTKSADNITKIRSTERRRISKALVDEINKIRADPKLYLSILQSHYDSFVDDFTYRNSDGVLIATREGKRLVADTIGYFESLSPMTAMSSSTGLETAALDHVWDMSQKPLLGHEGSDRSKPKDRIQRYCDWKGSLGENICVCEEDDPRRIVLSMVVDDGTPSRGHRKNILSPDFRFVGAAVGPLFGAERKFACVVDFAVKASDKEVPQPGGISDAIALEINSLRLNPSLYVELLQSRYESFLDEHQFKVGDAVRHSTEGRAIILEAIDFIQATPPLSSMQASSHLECAAIDHVNDLGQTNRRGHRGSDGSTLKDRIERYCGWRGIICENINYSNNSPTNIIIDMLIDDGVPNRVHRKNLLHPDYHYLGAAIGPHPQERLCCVIDFATKVTSFQEISRETNTNVSGVSEDVVAEINKLRSSPSDFASIAQHRLDMFVNDFEYNLPDGSIVQTIEGRWAVMELIDDLKLMSALPQMGTSQLLERAAIDHAKDIGEHDLLGHEGSDGSSVMGRLERYCHWRGAVEEVIDYGAHAPMDMILDLLIDDGDQSRSRRLSLLRPDLSYLGAAIGPHPQSGLCCVMNFASQVISPKHILNHDLPLKLKTLDDLSNDVVIKLFYCLPQDCTLMTDLKLHLMSNNEAIIEYNYQTKEMKISFIHGNDIHVQTLTLTYSRREVEF